MYARLYDSMLLWYQKWYSANWQLNAMAVTALSMSMFFNLLTISQVLWIIGFRHGSWLNLDHQGSVLYLLSVQVFSFIVNVGFARWKFLRERLQKGASPVAAFPRMAAPIYLSVSFLVCLGTLFGALATKP